MLLPCYCKPGTMSQCIAGTYNEQRGCVGFDKSTVANRCMHRNENMNNHCDNIHTQMIGLRDEVLDDHNTRVENLITESIEETTTCLSCIRCPCTYIEKKNEDGRTR